MIIKIHVQQNSNNTEVSMYNDIGYYIGKVVIKGKSEGVDVFTLSDCADEIECISEKPQVEMAPGEED